MGHETALGRCPPNLNKMSNNFYISVTVHPLTPLWYVALHSYMLAILKSTGFQELLTVTKRDHNWEICCHPATAK